MSTSAKRRVSLELSPHEGDQAVEAGLQTRIVIVRSTALVETHVEVLATNDLEAEGIALAQVQENPCQFHWTPVDISPGAARVFYSDALSAWLRARPKFH